MSLKSRTPCILISFLIVETKYLARSNWREGGFMSTHSPRVPVHFGGGSMTAGGWGCTDRSWVMSPLSSCDFPLDFSCVSGKQPTQGHHVLALSLLRSFVLLGHKTLGTQKIQNHETSYNMGAGSCLKVSLLKTKGNVSWLSIELSPMEIRRVVQKVSPDASLLWIKGCIEGLGLEFTFRPCQACMGPWVLSLYQKEKEK